MLPSNKSQEIASAFQCFVKTGDKTNIANIKYAELESAILQYSSARKESYYKAMESKLQELKDLKTESKNSIKTQKRLFLGILIGIIITVIGGILLHIIIKTYF